MNSKFWHEGLRFECQGSGGCCVSRGSYGYVWMTLEDRRRMAKVLKLSTAAFTRRYCRKQFGVWRLKDGETKDCLFLDGGKCAVYKGRPTQCRTWPFWPDALKPKVWTREIAAFCPGVGKGRLWSKDEIEAALKEQKASEDRYGS